MDFPIKNGGSFHSYVSLPEGNGIWPIILPSQGHGFPACHGFQTGQALHAHGGAVPDRPEPARGAAQPISGSQRGRSPGKNRGIQHDFSRKPWDLPRKNGGNKIAAGSWTWGQLPLLGKNLDKKVLNLFIWMKCHEIASLCPAFEKWMLVQVDQYGHGSNFKN